MWSSSVGFADRVVGLDLAARNADTVCKLVRRATAHGGSYIDAVIRGIGVRRILSFRLRRT